MNIKKLTLLENKEKELKNKCFSAKPIDYEGEKELLKIRKEIAKLKKKNL